MDVTGVKRVVGFSGGIDSQATALWVRQHFPADEIILLNTDAGGNEHPLTTEFIQWYSEHVFPVTVIQPLIKDLGNRGTKPGQARDRRQEFSDDDPLTFDRLAWIKGRFPSRKAQFCTEHLKLVPQVRWVHENLYAHGIDIERYIGVRRDEGNQKGGGCEVALRPNDGVRSKELAGRQHTPDREWDPFFDCYVNYPIAAWSKEQCFAYVIAAGEKYNPLYRLGFRRVGCAPCVNSSKEDIRLWAAQFPEMIDKVRRWERQNRRTFFPPCVPGKTINWIDDVVLWSRTSYGGKKIELPIFEAEVAISTCISRYGLCE